MTGPPPSGEVTASAHDPTRWVRPADRSTGADLPLPPDGAPAWSDMTMPLPVIGLPPVPEPKHLRGSDAPADRSDLALTPPPAAPSRRARHAAPDEPATEVPAPDDSERDVPATGSILRSASTVAVGTLVSRLTGFVRTTALLYALGDVVLGTYNIANTLPNIVYELLLGGVLTSVIVPLLVRSQQAATESGADPNVYPQRLLSLTVVGLTAATVVAIFLSPLLVALQGIHFGAPGHVLGTFLLALFLPQMIFYGIGALSGALLNIRGRYAAAAWAPVVNNVLVTAVAIYLAQAVFTSAPDPESIGTGTILLLGLGTTAGIVVQALVLMWAWRKVGFRWKWRLELTGVGLGELRSLAGWVVLYVVLGQVGLTVALNVANVNLATAGVYTTAQLLFQLPYGILGVSLLTAIMPRMSRAAAAGDWPQVKTLLATGTRLSALALVPASALMVFSVPLAVLVFAGGNFSSASAANIGIALAVSGFGLLPYAATLLQLRVFYAAKDARTPTLIMLGIVAVRVVLSLLCQLLPTAYVAAGLSVANSASFVIGAVIGDIALRRRFGPLGTGRVLLDVVRIVVAAVVALVVAVPVYLLLVGRFSDQPVLRTAALAGASLESLGSPALIVCVVVPSVLAVVVYLLVCWTLRVPEVRRLTGGLARRLSR